jgi:hypothetical protein
MSNWKERYEVRQKVSTGRFYVVDKHDDRWVKNFTFYYYPEDAKRAAANYYRAEQRKIEELLLGTNNRRNRKTR